MKRFCFLLLLTGSFLSVSAQPASDTILIFQTDSAHYCNIDSLYIDAGMGFISYYRVTVVDGTGTSYTDSVYVSLISADILQPDTILCYGEDITLSIRQKLPECQVAYYPFNGDTRDYSGRENHGYSFDATLVPDRFNNQESALSFSGKDSYMIATIPDVQSVFSVALWFRLPDTSFWYPENENPTLVDFANGQALVQVLGTREDYVTSGKLGKVRLSHFEGSGSPNNFSLLSDSNPSFETWHHLYAVFNTAGAANEIWIDGAKQGSSANTGQIVSAENRFLYFGRTQSLENSTSYFIGRIDEVSVYNCILDSLQLHNLIQSGSIFNYTYYWDTGDTASVITVSPETSSSYYATVTDGLYACTDSVHVDVNPEIKITLDQIDKGCPGEAKAKVLAKVSGGTAPYILEWDKGIKFLQGDTLALGLVDSVSYSIAATDSLACRVEETFEVEALPAPDVKFSYTPEEVYYQNPVVTFVSETDKASGWSWNFGDGDKSSLESPEHVFTKVETYHVVLTVTAENGCLDSLAQEIDIKEVELVIPNVFTPNGDGVNDTFVVSELDKYISNSLVVFNRWGQKVFEANDYMSGDWDGGNLSDGTYFFILKCKGYFEVEIYKGTINIFTGGFR
jgi:gliding motility-associated-like protein